MPMFNKIIGQQQKEQEKRKKRIIDVMNKVMDVIQSENISLSEMSDVIANLQVSYNRMLLEEINKLKSNERNPG